MRKVPEEWAVFDEERQAYYAWINAHFFTDEQLERIKARMSDLQAENAKLRELARDMWDWLAPTATISGAPLKELHGRIAELGVMEAE